MDEVWINQVLGARLVDGGAAVELDVLNVGVWPLKVRVTIDALAELNEYASEVMAEGGVEPSALKVVRG